MLKVVPRPGSLSTSIEPSSHPGADTEADGQAHPGARFALGGEEWVEESLF